MGIVHLHQQDYTFISHVCTNTCFDASSWHWQEVGWREWLCLYTVLYTILNIDSLFYTESCRHRNANEFYDFFTSRHRRTNNAWSLSFFFTVSCPNETRMFLDGTAGTVRLSGRTSDWESATAQAGRKAVLSKRTSLSIFYGSVENGHSSCVGAIRISFVKSDKLSYRSVIPRFFFTVYCALLQLILLFVTCHRSLRSHFYWDPLSQLEAVSERYVLDKLLILEGCK